MCLIQKEGVAAMDKITLLSSKALDTYFDILAKYGYKCNWAKNQLLSFLLIDELLHSSFVIYLKEEDYRYIEDYINCLMASTCMIPFGVFDCDPIYTLREFLISEDNKLLLSQDLDFLIREDYV